MSLFLQKPLRPAASSNSFNKVSKVAWHHAHPIVACVSSDKDLHVFDAKSLTPIYEKRFVSSILAIAWPETGAKLLAFVTSSTLNVVNLTASNEVLSENISVNESVKVSFTKNGSRIVVFSAKNIFAYRYSRTPSLIKVFTASYSDNISSIHSFGSVDFAIGSDSGDLAVLRDDQVFQIAKVTSKSPVRTVFNLSENEFITLSDTLSFIDSGRVSFTVKLSKDAKIELARGIRGAENSGVKIRGRK